MRARKHAGATDRSDAATQLRRCDAPCGKRQRGASAGSPHPSLRAHTRAVPCQHRHKRRIAAKKCARTHRPVRSRGGRWGRRRRLRAGTAARHSGCRSRSCSRARPRPRWPAAAGSAAARRARRRPPRTRSRPAPPAQRPAAQPPAPTPRRAAAAAAASRRAARQRPGWRHQTQTGSVRLRQTRLAWHPRGRTKHPRTPRGNPRRARSTAATRARSRRSPLRGAGVSDGGAALKVRACDARRSAACGAYRGRTAGLLLQDGEVVLRGQQARVRELLRVRRDERSVIGGSSVGGRRGRCSGCGGGSARRQRRALRGGGGQQRGVLGGRRRRRGGALARARRLARGGGGARAPARAARAARRPQRQRRRAAPASGAERVRR
jgi:hypothetical protein